LIVTSHQNLEEAPSASRQSLRDVEGPSHSRVFGNSNKIADC